MGKIRRRRFEFFFFFSQPWLGKGGYFRRNAGSGLLTNAEFLWEKENKSSLVSRVDTK